MCARVSFSKRRLQLWAEMKSAESNRGVIACKMPSLYKFGPVDDNRDKRAFRFYVEHERCKEGRGERGGLIYRAFVNLNIMIYRDFAAFSRAATLPLKSRSTFQSRGFRWLGIFWWCWHECESWLRNVGESGKDEWKWEFGKCDLMLGFPEEK